MTRQMFLQSLFNSDGLGLEIGPSHCPVFPKRDGFNIETVDYAPTEDLRRKYSEMGIPSDHIENVDYVTNGKSLADTIPHRNRYNYIFSSHNIEHLTDIVDFFISCELLLSPGGKVVLAIPDKRFMFDGMRHPSTSGEILEAHYHSANRHSLRAMFDYNANILFMDGQNTWNRDSRGTLAFEKDPSAAKAQFDLASQTTEYLDIHGWCFTPASFRLIMQDLNDLGLTRLGLDHIASMENWEFYAVLSAQEKCTTSNRLDLAKDVLREEVISGLQLLAEDDPVMGLALQALRRPDPATLW